MARRSCPLEGFEQCDTVFDQLNDLNRRSLALADSLDPAKLDLFSKSRFTKHCKGAVAGLHFKSSRNAWRFKPGDRYGGFLQACCGRTELTKRSRRTPKQHLKTSVVSTPLFPFARLCISSCP